MRNPPASAPSMPITVSTQGPYGFPLRTLPLNQPASAPTTTHEKMYMILLLWHVSTASTPAEPALLPLGRNGSNSSECDRRNLVEGGVRNIKSLNARAPLNHAGHDLRHACIGPAVVSLGV